MQQCSCTTMQHDNHSGAPCDKPALGDDELCKECRDKAVKEHAETEPDMLSYQARFAAHTDRQSELQITRKL